MDRAYGHKDECRRARSERYLRSACVQSGLATCVQPDATEVGSRRPSGRSEAGGPRWCQSWAAACRSGMPAASARSPSCKLPAARSMTAISAP